MSEQVYCVLDYETFSEADLKKVGGCEYSVHASTEILCVAFRTGTLTQLLNARTKTWGPSLGGDLQEFLDILASKSIILFSHNALFEEVITKNVLPKYIKSSPLFMHINTPPERWMCTASMAAALALPRSLDQACQALKMDVQKDAEGRKLMLKLCKPKKASAKDPSTRHRDPEELKRLLEYCVTDVAAEVGLLCKLPLLSEKERQVWLLDQKINMRGFLVDRPLVKKTLDLISREKGLLDAETQDLTFGAPESATQRDVTLRWLEGEGVHLEDLRKKTVSDVLSTEIESEDAKRLLQIRAAISKTSTAKYDAFEQRSRHDGRLRDILMYHGSSTGRWSGTGVQPQNFPRSVLVKNTKLAAEIMADSSLEDIRMLYGDPMTVFSDMLRSMIIAPPGKTLDVADYASIEVRVLFWLARNEAGLNSYRNNDDLYKLLASEIFGKSQDKITSSERFLGKSAVLGCGYGMGVTKFKASCEGQGVVVEETLAERAVKAYRSTHHPVPTLWKNLEAAAKYVIENPGKKVTLNYTQWYVSGGFLWCVLPSGRKLAYYGPKIKWETTTWGEKRPVIYHMGVSSLTKQWCEQKTWGGVLTENVIQAVARDLMAEAMLRIESAGPWEIVLSVHDELIAERYLNGPGTNAEFNRLMATIPTWAEGCPIQVEGWEGPRYHK